MMMATCVFVRMRVHVSRGGDVMVVVMVVVAMVVMAMAMMVMAVMVVMMMWCMCVHACVR